MTETKCPICLTVYTDDTEHTCSNSLTSILQNTSTFKREQRYYVAKIKDMEKYLTEQEFKIMEILFQKLTECRWEDRRRILECVVVESDWPEYEPTWRAIEKRMNPTHTEKHNWLR